MTRRGPRRRNTGSCTGTHAWLITMIISGGRCWPRSWCRCRCWSWCRRGMTRRSPGRSNAGSCAGTHAWLITMTDSGPRCCSRSRARCGCSSWMTRRTPRRNITGSSIGTQTKLITLTVSQPTCRQPEDQLAFANFDNTVVNRINVIISKLDPAVSRRHLNVRGEISRFGQFIDASRGVATAISTAGRYPIVLETLRCSHMTIIGIRFPQGVPKLALFVGLTRTILLD